MTSRIPRIVRAGVLAVALAAGLLDPVVAAAQGGDTEEFARRQYESGLAFLRDQKFAEALKDFQAIVDGYPASRVADAALLQIAQYQLDTAGDVEAAGAAVDALLKKYGTTESAPMAHVLAGRLLLSRGRAPADVEAALASFERVPRLFPGSEAVPASIYEAGETLRLTNRDGEAILRYRQVSTDYPASPWAARALLGEARCLVITGKPTRAMELLQRLRQRFPGSPQAATALGWNTLLYRLFLRPPVQPAFQFSGRTVAGTAGKLKDIEALAIDSKGHLFAAGKNGVLQFDPNGKGLPGVSAAEPKAIVFDVAGKPVVFSRGGYINAAGQPFGLAVPKNDGTPKPLEDIAAGLVTPFGEVIVADKDLRAIGRFTAAGKHVAPFAPVNASRLVMDPTGRVAALEADSAGVAILEADGRPKQRIPAKGQGYQFDKPVDLAVDPFGHLYVLDRNLATVFVFTQSGQLVTKVTIPEREPGAFRRAAAMALDAAGRLYVFDDEAEKVQIYQ